MDGGGGISGRAVFACLFALALAVAGHHCVWLSFNQRQTNNPLRPTPRLISAFFPQFEITKKRTVAHPSLVPVLHPLTPSYLHYSLLMEKERNEGIFLLSVFPRFLRVSRKGGHNYSFKIFTPLG